MCERAMFRGLLIDECYVLSDEFQYISLTFKLDWWSFNRVVVARESTGLTFLFHEKYWIDEVSQQVEHVLFAYVISSEE